MLIYCVLLTVAFAAMEATGGPPIQLPAQWFCFEGGPQTLLPPDDSIPEDYKETEELYKLVIQDIELVDESQHYSAKQEINKDDLTTMMFRLVFAVGRMWDFQGQWENWTPDEMLGGAFWPNHAPMPEKAEAEKFFDAETNAWSNKLAKQVSFIHDGFEVLNRKEALDFWRKKGLTQYEAFAVFFWTKTGPAKAWQSINSAFRFNLLDGTGPNSAASALQALKAKTPGYVEYFYLVLSAMRKIREPMTPQQAEFDWAKVAGEMKGWPDPGREITLSRGQHCPDFRLMNELADYVSSEAVFELRGFTTNKWASCLFSYGTLGTGLPTYDGSRKPSQVEVMGCEWANSFIHRLRPDAPILVAKVYMLSGFPQEYEHALLWGSRVTTAKSEILYNQREECKDTPPTSTPGCPKGPDIATTEFNIGISDEGWCGRVTSYWPALYTENVQSLKSWADGEWMKCKPVEGGGGILPVEEEGGMFEDGSGVKNVKFKAAVHRIIAQNKGKRRVASQQNTFSINTNIFDYVFIGLLMLCVLHYFQKQKKLGDPNEPLLQRSILVV